MNTTPIPDDRFTASTIPVVRRFNLAQAAECAVKALGSSRDWDLRNEAGKALRYLTEFVNEMEEKPAELTEREAELASSIHTYLRKYCDDPMGTLLYHLIARSEGIGVWLAFVKGAAEEPNKMRLRHANALRHADAYADENSDNPKNLYMRCALRAWPKNQFESMLVMFKKDGWVSWL
jgi:hypothetical protein